MLEKYMGPRVHFLLAHLLAPAVRAETKRDYQIVQEPQIIELQSLPSLPKQVETFLPMWRRFRDECGQLTKACADEKPGVVFPVLTCEVITRRRLYRRYLRKHFGFDVKRGGSSPGFVPPTDWRDIIRLSWGIMKYRFYDKVFFSCLDALFIADIGQKNFDEALSNAVTQMDAVWRAYPLFVVAMGMLHADDEMRRLATNIGAAWVATQISLSKNKPASTRLSKALDNERLLRGAASRSRFTELLAWLPPNVYRAYQEGNWRTPKELRARIVSLLEHEGSDWHPKEILTDEPVHIARQTLDDLTYEAVARKLEEEDQYIASLSKQAQLTHLEEQVTRLQLQIPPSDHPRDHFSDQDIADMLNRSLGSVKQAWRSARKKLTYVLAP